MWWTPRDVAKMLVFAALFAVTALVLFPAVARPATPGDAERGAWYLKGEADAVFGARGWTVGKLACKPRAGAFIVCQLRLDSRAGASLCSHGRFRLARFSVAGQMSAPKRCTGAPQA